MDNGGSYREFAASARAAQQRLCTFSSAGRVRVLTVAVLLAEPWLGPWAGRLGGSPHPGSIQTVDTCGPWAPPRRRRNRHAGARAGGVWIDPAIGPRASSARSIIEDGGCRPQTRGPQYEEHRVCNRQIYGALGGPHARFWCSSLLLTRPIWGKHTAEKKPFADGRAIPSGQTREKRPRCTQRGCESREQFRLATAIIKMPSSAAFPWSAKPAYCLRQSRLIVSSVAWSLTLGSCCWARLEQCGLAPCPSGPAQVLDANRFARRSRCGTGGQCLFCPAAASCCQVKGARTLHEPRGSLVLK
ncbi:hypothetical protein GQ53DRAFT_437413 [Thozetella sp. PMI_491]|nr:hypothetical protein GQ53DRAFT_437413 [Thozetella sp. PMI_491]